MHIILNEASGHARAGTGVVFSVFEFQSVRHRECRQRGWYLLWSCPGGDTWKLLILIDDKALCGQDIYF